MCTGEVDRNVWMRLRLAGLIASAQRSMSFGEARERPQMTAFFERLAISLPAAKTPSEAIGKPASIMSTPMVSSSSATSSFSSWVMVAPGHCSPSRSVVSKMTTRSLSDWVWLAIGLFLLVECAIQGRSMGADFCPLLPQSAKAQKPSRPSGADKEKERAQNEGGNGRWPGGRPSDRAVDLPRRHLLRRPSSSTAKIANLSKVHVN